MYAGVFVFDINVSMDDRCAVTNCSIWFLFIFCVLKYSSMIIMAVSRPSETFRKDGLCR